jgi:hypothetical protein
MENENKYNPENLNKEHDITEGYVNSSPSQFIDFVSQFDDDARLNLHLHLADANPTTINNLLRKFANAKVEIYCDKEDYLKNKHLFPPNIEWRVE